MSQCPPEPPSWLALANPVLYTIQKSAYDTCMAQQEGKTPIVPPELAPYIVLAILGGSAVGITAIVADAYKNKKVIQEVWHDQPAKPDYERLGKFRKYVKDWFKRHKKEMNTLVGIFLLAGAGLLAARGEPERQRKIDEMERCIGEYTARGYSYDYALAQCEKEMR